MTTILSRSLKTHRCTPGRVAWWLGRIDWQEAFSSVAESEMLAKWSSLLLKEIGRKRSTLLSCNYVIYSANNGY